MVSSRKQVFEIPFNSTDKFQANIHIRNGTHLISLKGAPERVLERCSTIAYGSETRELTEETRNAYTQSCYDLANNGERVLGFADLELPSKSFPKGFAFKSDPPNFPLENLRLVNCLEIIAQTIFAFLFYIFKWTIKILAAKLPLYRPELGSSNYFSN